ncbi:hypothetical protein ACFQX4_00860 [Roseomonas sp. GCM10028921]
MVGDMRNSGEFRAGSNMQRGQRVAANYFMRPAILFANQDMSRLGAGVGGWGGFALGLAGAAMSTSGMQVTLSVFSMRAGLLDSLELRRRPGRLRRGRGRRARRLSAHPRGPGDLATFVDA